MSKKSGRKIKGRKRRKRAPLLSKHGRAIEAKLSEIVNKEIAEHRKIPREQVDAFLAKLLPPDPLDKSAKSFEDIDRFEVTGQSVIFKPMEAPKEAPKSTNEASSEEESYEDDDDSEDDEEEEESDSEEPVKEAPATKGQIKMPPKQVILKEKTTVVKQKVVSIEKEKSTKTGKMSDRSKMAPSSVSKNMGSVKGAVGPSKQQIKSKQSAEPVKGKQMSQAKGKTG